MEKPIDLIKDAFEQKTWNEIHITDSWRVFKIISELVEGFEKLARIGLVQGEAEPSKKGGNGPVKVG